MEELKEKLRQAQQNFDYADENYIDAAIMDLNAAEERLNCTFSYILAIFQMSYVFSLFITSFYYIF